MSALIQIARVSAMGNIIDAASAILSRSERRVEVAAQNIANSTTPGYKRHISFQKLISEARTGDALPESEGLSVDLAPGKLNITGAPYDLAIAGDGFFVVDGAEGPLLTRRGQFQRTADGRLVDGQGRALQVEGGGDLVLKTTEFKVLEDGAVIENGVASTKLSIVNIDNPKSVHFVAGDVYSASLSAMKQIEKPSVHQGMLEASNISMGAEMISIMGALRRAETGQRLVGVYDDLMGRVISTIGQAQ